MIEKSYKDWPQAFKPKAYLLKDMEELFVERRPICILPPQAIHIELTNQCNLRCRMCYNSYVDRPISELNDCTILNIVEKAKLRRVHLQGIGEPLLHPNVINIVRSLTVSGCYVTLTTNGILLDEKKLNKLINAGLKKVIVSFDSSNSTTFEYIRGKAPFNCIKNNVKMLIQKYYNTIGVEINIVFFPEFIEDLRQTLYFLLNLGDPKAITIIHQQYSSYKHLMPSVKRISAEQIEYIFRDLVYEYKKRKILFDIIAPSTTPDIKRCSWPWNAPFLLADGTVTPCCCLLDIKLGNVLESSLLSLWNNRAYQNIRSMMEGNTIPAMCKGCNYL